MRNFFADEKPPTALQLRGMAKGKVITTPRLATLDFMRMFQNSLKWGTGKDYSSFDSKELLKTCDTVNDGIVQIPQCASVGKPNGCPNLLVLCSDRQSTQFCAMFFLMFKLLLNILFIADPAHVSWRAILDAITKAGYGAAVDTAKAMYNIAYGPFQKSAFYKYLVHAAADISASLKSNDPLLLFFWRGICDDNGWTSDEDVGEAGRDRYLKSLMVLPQQLLKEQRLHRGDSIVLSRLTCFGISIVTPSFF